MSNLYSQYKVCSLCGHEDQRGISAEIAAFEERRKWTEACSKCGNQEVSSSGVALPELTKELMEIWSRDDSLSFYEQDEDICLAEANNIELLLEFLDSNNTLASKRSMLLATLCVLIHDNVPDDEQDDSDINIEVANRVAGELKKRIELFVELDTSLIMDYIKELAYPQIGVPLAGM
ncbi:hypothetical protein FKG94_28605 [Exilibacterium tricleocarpae]|uniref:Uncharacterized protein n=3 Tax=Exilibacterium tricleocarpae TaxID=2591008 RepID=A0A545SKP2_9GAMM|nr:hypothetical protein FKG94_28605 [Exilibacterium tricleocarpae]